MTALLRATRGASGGGASANPKTIVHLRFENRRYFGHSKYKPKEGWLDVYAIKLEKPKGADMKHIPPMGTQDENAEAAFGIYLDPVVPMLQQAAAQGINVGSAEVEMDFGEAGKLMWLMDNVYISEMSVGGGAFDLRLECSMLTRFRA